MPSEVDNIGDSALCCRRPSIPPNLPEILENTARTLKGNGCSPTLVRAAMLSICGVEVREVSLSAIRVS